ncbi:Domain of unknown function DUF4211 [Phaffia rhodozyma]|uniref:DUF4211 domain-containing protein n=1 Tax=Phaffia rhodozyma TaxID=264483 RepID=A0A0F7SK09_PHARH|nr:Domain of unknown function DUF4211 [Phaffia rhodozyma]
MLIPVILAFKTIATTTIIISTVTTAIAFIILMGQQTKLDSFVFTTSDSPNDSKYISFVNKDQILPTAARVKQHDPEDQSLSSEHSGEEGFVLDDKPVILSPPSRSSVSLSSSSSSQARHSRKLVSRSNKRVIQSSSSSESDQDRVSKPLKRNAKMLKRPRRAEAEKETLVASNEPDPKVRAVSAKRKDELILEVVRNLKGKGKSQSHDQHEKAGTGTSSPPRPTEPSHSPSTPSGWQSASNSLFGSSPPNQASQSQLIIRPPIEEDYDSDLIIIDDSSPTSPIKPIPLALPAASAYTRQPPVPSPPPIKLPSNTKSRTRKKPSTSLVKPGHSRIIKKAKTTPRQRIGYVTASSSSDSSEEVEKPTGAGRTYKRKNRTRGLPSSSDDDSAGSEDAFSGQKAVVTQRMGKSRMVVSEDETKAIEPKETKNNRSTLKSISYTSRQSGDLGSTPSSSTVPKVEKENGSKRDKPPNKFKNAESLSNTLRKPVTPPTESHPDQSEDVPDLFYSSPEQERYVKFSNNHRTPASKPEPKPEHEDSSKSSPKHDSSSRIDDASLDLEVRLSKAFTPITVETAPLELSSSRLPKPLTTRQRLSMSIVSSKEVALKPKYKSVSESKGVSSTALPEVDDKSSMTSSDPLAEDGSAWVGPNDVTHESSKKNEEEQVVERRMQRLKGGKGGGPSKQRIIVTSEEEDDNNINHGGRSEATIKSTRQKKSRVHLDPSDSDEENENGDSSEGLHESEVEDLEDDQGKLRIVEARMRSAEDRKSKQALARQSALERLKHKKGKKGGSSVQTPSTGSSTIEENLDQNNVWAKDEDGEWIVSGDEGNSGYITDDIEDADYTSLMPMEFRSDASQPMDQCFHVICQWHVHYIIQGRPFLKLSAHNDYFRIPMLRLREKMTDVKNQVASQIWPSPFNLSLQTYPAFTGGAIKDAPPCAACRMTNRPATRAIVLRGDPYNKKTFKDLDANWGRKGPPETSYNVGKYCYARAHKFHELAHWEYNLHHALIAILQVLRKSVHKDDDGDEDDEDVEIIAIRETVKIAGKTERVDSLPDYNRPDKVTEWLQKRQWIKQEWLHISDLLLCNENLNAPWKKTD